MMCTARFYTRCSSTLIRRGFSPGACVVLKTLSAETWVTDRTVAEHIIGAPIKPQNIAIIPMINMSR